jgi:rhodanese-related sulfurtransferase
VIHTPGHRKELISLLVVNPERSSEPSMVLTGDSMLVGDVGRPDFGGGDAREQYDSISHLLRLPDWVAVFPGHFEGPCGNGMCGRPSTTIGFERLYNPLLHMDREPFVESLTAHVPARPLNMVAIEATNRGKLDMPWAMLNSSPEIERLHINDVRPHDDSTYLLDVREPEEYAHGHVPGAANIPQAELALRLDEIPRDRPITVICQTGMRSFKSAQFLVQQGFQNVRSVDGGTSAWMDTGKPVDYGDTSVAKPNITESEWGHAGVLKPV